MGKLAGVMTVGRLSSASCVGAAIHLLDNHPERTPQKKWPRSRNKITFPRRTHANSALASARMRPMMSARPPGPNDTMKWIGCCR
jgi:hypothetical protein